MVNTGEFVDMLETLGYKEFCGVPCSNLTYLINELCNRGMYTPYYNEGDAVAYAAGQYLSGQRRVGILLQNSGLTNALSPLTSLTSIYRIPILMIIGDRGDKQTGSETKYDEPQHRYVGKFTRDLIDIGFDGRDLSVIKEKGQTASVERFDPDHNIVFLVESKDSFTEVKLIETRSKECELTLKDIIDGIDRVRDKDTVLVTTTGYTSRIAYMDHRPTNFYVVGSMGCAYSVGRGMAVANRKKKVIVLDGDGSVLMRPSAVMTGDAPKNLYHIVAVNGTHNSTGGQSLGRSCYDKIRNLLKEYGYTETAETAEFVKGINTGSGAVLRISNEVPKDLPRPKESLDQLRDRFMTETADR